MTKLEIGITKRKSCKVAKKSLILTQKNNGKKKYITLALL